MINKIKSYRPLFVTNQLTGPSLMTAKISVEYNSIEFCVEAFHYGKKLVARNKTAQQVKNFIEFWELVEAN
jgi:hypothetical protein